MTRSHSLRPRPLLPRLSGCGFILLALVHCGEQGRARRFADPQLHDQLPPSSLPDADVPIQDELDAGVPPPDTTQDAGDDFVKFWDGSTTPTADYVRHIDAGEVDARGADVDASAP